MGDVSTEPTMEEILSSIKRVIEESEAATPMPRRAAARTNARSTPAADTGDAAGDDDDEVLELSDRVAFPSAPAESGEPPAPVRNEPILSADAAQASRGSLETLSRLIVKPDVAGADTLEGLVRDMLKPMLRDWLDTNLPDIVETMVAKEIARISGRGL